ncbi:MAG: hypothetical protein PHQ12_07505 [Chthoniobacteraceae bacterium]|nr:hypothetical protein [Chthoniobacteraceae bacterium]
MNDYAAALAKWQAFTRDINARARRLDDSIHERGWALAATVGIPRCGCSVHNASIDDAMTGWCAGNPERLKVAKRAAYLLSLWPGSNLAERINRRAYNRILADVFGMPGYKLQSFPTVGGGK